MPSLSNIKNLTSFAPLFYSPAMKQLAFMLGIAVSITLGIALFWSIQEPIYRPLDYQVTSKNLPMIVDTLEKAGIDYKISDNESMVSVPAKDIQLARLKLMAAGVPKDDGFTFNYLNDQNSIGNSQFLENARYLRALETDLAKTISAIEGVYSAKVHIAMPENNIFADENKKPTASVLLSAAPGLSSDKEKIRAIVQIVASSVPGLDPDDVAITDQYGHYLSSNEGSQLAFSAEQLSYQNNVQSYYERRIESLIAPLVGQNKVSVRVYAKIDFSQQEEASEKYDPTQQVIRSEETTTEQTSGASSSAGGPPGSLSNSPPNSDADKRATGQGGGGDSRSESIKNYELGKSVTYKKENFAKIDNLSVAVVVDNEAVYDPKTKAYVKKPIDKDRINKITDLVKASIGYDDKKGDKVTVVNSSFNVDDTANQVSDAPLWHQPWFWDLIKKSVGMLLGFAFLFLLYHRLSKQAKGLKSIASPNQGLLEKDSNYMTQEMQDLKQEQIARLKELATHDPNRVSAVIKNWIGRA